MEVRGNHYLTQQSSTYGHLLPQLVIFKEKFNWNYFCTVISQTRFSHCFLYAWINKFFLTKYRLPVWKFQNFYVTSFEFYVKSIWGILEVQNLPILPYVLAHSETLNSDFYQFLHFLISEHYQIHQIQSYPKMAKTAFLELLEPLKLISRKIWLIEKSPLAIFGTLTQCGKFSIFLPLRFYVKSNFWILELQKMQF